jgi:hypothetical protein
MQDCFTFIQLGFRHITDLDAMDHILFLLALAAIYQPRDWRKAMWVVTAFTIGHSVTLGLAVTGAIRLPTKLIEFLIPVTIVATCIENIIVKNRDRALWGGKYRPVFAGVFGLVHGAGFANYLRDLFGDHIAVPLFGFNIGIEIGQIAVLTVAGIALLSADWLIARARESLRPESVLRLRVIAVSFVVMIVAGHWAIQRHPW